MCSEPESLFKRSAKVESAFPEWAEEGEIDVEFTSVPDEVEKLLARYAQPVVVRGVSVPAR